MIAAFTSFRSISFLPCVTILMAELLVSLLGEQLGSILFRELEQEVRLVVGVEEEVEKLKSNLSAIQAVLADAEARQVKEATVRDWLEKLKDIAYDIMDVRDDWEAAILSSQSKPGDELNKPERKVCSFLQSSCFCCKQVPLRHDIARKIKGLNQKLDLLAQEKERYKFVSTEANQPIERSMTVSMIEITEVKGREEDKDKLVERLLSESSGGEGSDLRVVSIVGMGGIGKTTLAQFAFNHDRIKAYFGDNKFWVCVSDPFDEIRVANAIYTGLLRSPPDVKELEDILRKIGESIKDKRFLLILDDVWEENRTKWDRLKQCLKHGLSGSKVLITTRNEKVASVMNCSEDYVVRVGNLREEECWSILSKIAFFDRSDIECKDLEENFSKEMSKKCKGLPLAAKTLGGILQFRKTKEEWQSILSSDVWELEEGEKDVIGPIWLSYYDLSPALKRCFSYCAIFPKDHLIRKHQLIGMWMAQGYLQPTRNNDLEVHGEIYFENLVMRSFFQKVEEESDYNHEIYKMHDMVHDVAQMVARNECCSTQMVDDRVELIRTSRHLHLDLPSHGSCLNSCHGLKKKRSLLLCSKSSLDGLSSLFGELLHVRSLSLTYGDFEEIPPSIRKLVQLRWLGLSDNYKLKQLPAALCELHSLQTLDVSGCLFLEQLPLGIGKLINLRHLHNLGGPTELPKGIAELTGLRTLEEVDVGGDGDAFSLGDLKNLNQLRGSLELRGLGAHDHHVGEAKQAELKKKAHITRLDLCFSFRENEEEGCTPRNEELLLEALEPSPNLELLSISLYGGTTFPGWLISLTNLKSIILGSCESCDRLPSLGKLPSLETLELHYMSGVKKVGVELLGIETQIGESKSEVSASSSSSPPPPSSPVVVAFPKLTTLQFWEMDSWQEWDDYYYYNNHCDGTTKPPASIMPSLRTLKIVGCPRLKALSDYILQNKKLQSLEIYRSDLLKERYNKEKGEDWSKISDISHVTLYPP